MKENNLPNPYTVSPLKDFKHLNYVKPTIKNKNITVGEFTYISDGDFENHVTHFYDFIGDKLKIGKFCQIGKGVNFIMNGANHKFNSVSTYPFYIFDGWEQTPPSVKELPIKGDTEIGNDVWIGENVTFLPGVKVGDGAIIGASSVVGSNVPPYSVAVGNPVRVIKRRFDEETIELLLKFKWWDLSVEEIQKIIPILSSDNLNTVKNYIKESLGKK